MTTKKIITYPEVTKYKAEPVTSFNADFMERVSNLIETMEVYDGIGLAATQIGYTDSMFAANISGVNGEAEPFTVFINPEILSETGESKSEEGCLSFPQIGVTAIRPISMALSFQDLDGNRHVVTLKYRDAAVVQHEMDHLGGKTFLDRISPLKRTMVKKKIRKLKRAGIWPDEY